MNVRPTERESGGWKILGLAHNEPTLEPLCENAAFVSVNDG